MSMLRAIVDAVEVITASLQRLLGMIRNIQLLSDLYCWNIYYWLNKGPENKLLVENIHGILVKSVHKKLY